jgi:hypothetical protein
MGKTIIILPMSCYYLKDAVNLMGEFIESAAELYYNGRAEYYCRFEHCWDGDYENPFYIS